MGRSLAESKGFEPLVARRTTTASKAAAFNRAQPTLENSQRLLSTICRNDFISSDLLITNGVKSPYTMKYMSAELVVRGRDESVMAARKKWTTRVLQYFTDKLPELRLVIFLDDSDAPTLKRGIENRGLFSPSNRDYFRMLAWPRAVAEALRTINPTAVESTYHYDCVVYLHDSTCRAEDSLTMTVAHELQHFIQYGFNRSIWAWNKVVTNLHVRTIDTLGLAWRDIPIEYEARIVAKQASETILGRERTAQYIENRKNQCMTNKDAADWGFIQSIDTAQPYDCAVQTQALFRRLTPVRNELQLALNNMKGLPDFARLDLDDMMGPQRR
jgi:hypothetical protein